MMINMDPQNTSKDSIINTKNFITDISIAFVNDFTLTFIRIFNFIDDYLIFELMLLSSQLIDSCTQFRDNTSQVLKQGGYTE